MVTLIACLAKGQTSQWESLFQWLSREDVFKIDLGTVPFWHAMIKIDFETFPFLECHKYVAELKMEIRCKADTRAADTRTNRSLWNNL